MPKADLIKAALRDHRLLQAALLRAKKVGYFWYYAHGAEKYNHADSQEPHADGSFDVEGYCSEDIDAAFTLRAWHPEDVGAFFSTLWTWLKDSVELRSLSFAAETLPFGFPWRAWAWTVNSVDCALNEAADELARDRAQMEHGSHWSQAKYDCYKRYVAEYRQSLTRKKAMKALETNGDYVQVSEEIWVSASDPTVFYCDDLLVPYDLKDGWSAEKIGYILSLWSLAVDLPVMEFKLDPGKRAPLQELAVWLVTKLRGVFPWLR